MYQDCRMLAFTQSCDLGNHERWVLMLLASAMATVAADLWLSFAKARYL